MHQMNITIKYLRKSFTSKIQVITRNLSYTEILSLSRLGHNLVHYEFLHCLQEQISGFAYHGYMHWDLEYCLFPVFTRIKKKKEILLNHLGGSFPGI